MDLPANIPSWIYTAIGLTIVSNIGTIGTLIWAGIKVTWMVGHWKSKIESRLDYMDEKANKAHTRIDSMKSDIKELRNGI